MRRITMFCLVLILSVSIFSGCTRVNPGYVGIKVNMAGSQKGVEDFPQVTGWVFYMPGMTQVLEYPTFMQTYVYSASHQEGKAANEEITFSDSAQTPISADINISYTLDGTKVPSFYVKFRNDDINGFTHGYLRNVMRDCYQNVGSRYSFDDINGAKKETFSTEVKTAINKEVGKYGVTVDQLGFVGALRPPQNILDSINAKNQANQDAVRKENELRQAKADAAKAVAAAEGKAQANERLARSLTPVLMEWRRLEITEAAVAKWNGARPMVEGNSSGLLLNISPKQ